MKEPKAALPESTIPASLEECRWLVERRLASFGSSIQSSAIKQKVLHEAEKLWKACQILRVDPVSPPFLTDALNNSIRAKASANARKAYYVSNTEVGMALDQIADRVGFDAVEKFPASWLVLLVCHVASKKCDKERLAKLKKKWREGDL